MNRTPPDHGASMFRGAFGPIVKLGPQGPQIRNTPKPVPGGEQQSITVNDAQPLSLPYQP